MRTIILYLSCLQIKQKELGRGISGEVKSAYYKNQLVAVKLFKNDSKSEKDFLQEVKELKSVSHENIIKIIAYGKWKQNSAESNCIVIELADVGSLHHVLYETHYEYTLGHAIRWLKQCASAIEYLHARKPKPLLHRDLKPLKCVILILSIFVLTLLCLLCSLNHIFNHVVFVYSLLLMNGGTLLKVCDFGTVCDLRTQMTMEKGSPCWIAPEQLSGIHINKMLLNKFFF